MKKYTVRTISAELRRMVRESQSYEEFLNRFYALDKELDGTNYGLYFDDREYDEEGNVIGFKEGADTIVLFNIRSGYDYEYPKLSEEAWNLPH